MARQVGVAVASFVLAFSGFLCGAAAQYDSCITGAVADIGNGRCDAALNVPSCGYDGGDCCPCTCIDGPDHACSDIGTSTCVFPDCNAWGEGLGGLYETEETSCIQSQLANGLCQAVNNNKNCSWDGGDVSLCCSHIYASTGGVVHDPAALFLLAMKVCRECG